MRGREVVRGLRGGAASQRRMTVLGMIVQDECIAFVASAIVGLSAENVECKNADGLRGIYLLVERGSVLMEGKRDCREEKSVAWV